MKNAYQSVKILSSLFHILIKLQNISKMPILDKYEINSVISLMIELYILDIKVI